MSDSDSPAKADHQLMPLLPLRDVVVFPRMVIPLFVGRSESISALQEAMGQEKQIFLVAQKDPNVDKPKRSDLYNIGTVSTILQLLRLPDGTVKVLVEGSHRAKAISIAKKKSVWWADLDRVDEQGDLDASELEAYIRSAMTHFEKLVKVSKKLPVELLSSLANIQDAGRLADSMAAHMTVKLESRQKILESTSIKKRFDLLRSLMEQELELLDMDKRLQGRVKKQVEKSQRQYYLGEKMKAIQHELDELDSHHISNPLDEYQQLREKIEAAGMPSEAKEKAIEELGKLKMMPPMSAEATVTRNYLDKMIQVPWKKKSQVNTELGKAEEVLEADHYGLVEVKQRILEYLAVQKRVKKLKGPILCLVGPPGVGKTSLGRSIANATGRVFVRMSLGGVRDEAEIRGHRRTYIGALPGKIIQKMTKAKVRNPLFMLDEVDKMAMDFRGDPASALLEVLDPEQNDTFNDHYLEVDYDLSDVMFIATANSLNIPDPLLDRMEIIRLPGYTEEEKLNIAKRYLVPRQMKQTGLLKKELAISDDALLDVVRRYTREAGVRSLEREIAKLCRKVVKDLTVAQQGKPKKTLKQKRISRRTLEKYLGVFKYRYGVAEKKDRIGQVTGLAWTQVGGELLSIEVQVLSGKGKSQQTGSLGDVMQESIAAAMTVVRSRADLLSVDKDYFQSHDFHIHVPEGATPKDGPSAGIGMCTALVSAITKIPVRADVAMTGEITLRGEVLPIGGLKEKLLAALRGGIKEVIIPEENARELKEIPEEVTSYLHIHPVKMINEVLAIALNRPLAKNKSPSLVYVEPKQKKPKQAKKKLIKPSKKKVSKGGSHASRSA